VNELPFPLGPGDKVTGTWINQLLRAIRRQKPLCGPGISTRVTPDGTVLTAAAAPARAQAAAPLAPFTVRHHRTGGDAAGQWEIYLPPGCCSVGGACDVMNARADAKSGHEGDGDGWYEVPGPSRLVGTQAAVGEGEDARQVTRKSCTVRAHVKPSAKVYGVDAIDAPARRLLAVCVIDDYIVNRYISMGRPDLAREFWDWNAAGDVFSAQVAEIAITEDGGVASRTVTQNRTAPIDLVPPAGTGVSGFDLVWNLEMSELGMLYTRNLFCVRQVAAAAGISLTGDTMTDVVNASKVYARIDATDMTDGSGVVQVVKDPQDAGISSPYVVWLPLYDLKNNNCLVTADHRPQSLVNLQLFHA